MGIDPKQLDSLLQSQNQMINTGEIRAGEQQLRVTANGMYTTIDDIRNQVITTKAGQVKLGFQLNIIFCSVKVDGEGVVPCPAGTWRS